MTRQSVLLNVSLINYSDDAGLQRTDYGLLVLDIVL